METRTRAMGGARFDEVSIDDVDERVKKVIQGKKLSSLHPVLKRKEIYWLLDGGEGYYVIEALNTGK